MAIKRFALLWWISDIEPIMGNSPTLPGRQRKFDRSGSSRGKLLLMNRQAYQGLNLNEADCGTARTPPGSMRLFPRFAAFGRGHGPLLRQYSSVGAAHGRD